MLEKDTISHEVSRDLNEIVEYDSKAGATKSQLLKLGLNHISKIYPKV
jgi:hypothetical protein